VKLVRCGKSFCRSLAALPEFAAIEAQLPDYGKYGESKH
jgi:hypothetical protein